MQSLIPTPAGYVDVAAFTITLEAATSRSYILMPDHSSYESRGRADGTGEVVRTPAP